MRLKKHLQESIEILEMMIFKERESESGWIFTNLNICFVIIFGVSKNPYKHL